MGAPTTARRARAGDRRYPAPAPDSFAPMLCETARELPPGDGWTYEPKLDGIRVITVASPAGVSLRSRNGNEKAAQFPEVVAALQAAATRLGKPFVMDGELVAVDPHGGYRRFEALQGRMHVRDASIVAGHARSSPAVFVAFDLLLEGATDIEAEAWTARRARLERLMERVGGPRLHLGESGPDGREMVRRAREAGWEGIVAKRADAPYRAGKRSREWLKLKLENRQELVIGGWTEPRRSREHLGAILLGYYDAEGKFVYAGHTGTGFTRTTLESLYRRLARLERKTSPFSTTPRTNEPAHWVTPRLVAEVKFNEWTSDGRLRQPSFLGLRDDKDPRSVVREPPSLGPDPLADRPLVRAIRDAASESSASLSVEGVTVVVTNLRKRFFPDDGYTKADLLAYYAGMADRILPWMEDRPLVLKRFPNGIAGEAFYQQSAPRTPPAGVRVERVSLGEGHEEQLRFVGGSLATLLHTVQLGAISYDPWHSRVGELESADYTVLDLDPGVGATFLDVVRVARWVREEMDALGLTGALKTSGSSGLHIYLPLEPGTPLEAATLVAQIVATRVAQKHPETATVERMVRNRPRGTVYVDYLQNILGKTVAGVYAVRAKPGATVSTPLAWDELTDDLDLRAFTIATVPARLRAVGDLWGPAMAEPNSAALLLSRGRTRARRTR